MLNLILFTPIIAAFAVLLGAPARKTSLAAAAVNLALTLFALVSYNQSEGGFQLPYIHPLVPAWDLKFYLAVDGLSLVMLLLTSLVTFAAIWLTQKIEKRENLFYACLLFIAAGATGAFLSQDLFFFYAFHELALIPTFLLIGLWGSGDRQTAAWKITIYLAFGSFVLLVGLLDLYNAIPLDHRTLDMVELQKIGAAHLIPASAQGRPFILLLAGFGILVSLFPFHSWAPTAYASAPTPAAMLHAGVLKKFGLYGLIRIAVPLLPAGAQQWAWLLLILLIGNVIYVGLVTIAQRRLDLMLGYSSVMHMGYIFLGIAALNVVGLSGAVMLMFAHGLSIAILFGITGQLRTNSPGLAFENLGGLAKTMPFLAAAFGCAAFASIGLPGFANFASELMVFFGAFKPAVDSALTKNYQIATVFALWGVVISAVYMLRGYRAIFLGTAKNDSAAWPDSTVSNRIPMTLLIAALLITGFFPGTLLNFIKPAIQSLLAH